MNVTDEPMIVDQVFKQTTKDVGKAITEIDQMRQWFFNNIPDFKPQIRCKTRFKVAIEDRTFTHLWEVVALIPFKKLTYNWNYKEYPGDSLVQFEVFETKGMAHLRLTTKVTEDFPDLIPEFSRESCVDGWNYFIKERLLAYMNKI